MPYSVITAATGSAVDDLDDLDRVDDLGDLDRDLSEV